MCFAVAVFLAIYGSFAVDKNNFKTCEQSGFCKRLRAYTPDKSHYVLNIDTVIVHGNVLTAEVFSVTTEAEKKNPLVSRRIYKRSFERWLRMALYSNQIKSLRAN